MKSKNKWRSPQAIIVTAIILIIFVYMVVDINFFFDQKKDIDEVKVQYNELSTFLDKKVPEIDSTFGVHSSQIEEIRHLYDTLNESFSVNVSE